MEQIQNILLTLILGLICTALAYMIRTNKQDVLTYVASLVQAAEKAINGSHMGAVKKRLVIDQLEAAGVKVTAWLSNQIDLIVKALNSRGAWLAEQTQEGISGLTGSTPNTKEACSDGTGDQ